MEIEDFYLRLLELESPWFVKNVALGEGLERIDVFIEWMEDARFACPYCGVLLPPSGRSPTAAWRHLDTCRGSTYIHSELPNVHCAEHGEQMVRPPWAEGPIPVTTAYQERLNRLIEEVGAKKANRLMGLSGKQTGLRRTRKPAADRDGAGKPATRKTDATGGSPPARQILLFEQKDMAIINEGILALKNLQLEQALDLFEKHEKIYPGGYDIESRKSIAQFLLRGFHDMPPEPPERAGYLCRLWNELEDLVLARDMRQTPLLEGMRRAFFERVRREMCEAGMESAPFLAGGAPSGYVFLQTGEYERAVQSLQGCVGEGTYNAAVLGYLGDAYTLLGDSGAARECYREACLIDPAGIDWSCMRDEALKELKEEISTDYGYGEKLAVQWLPSHARVAMLFGPKPVGLNSGLKELADEYLKLQKAMEGGENPEIRAKLFFRGIVLCENEESLKFIKKIHLAQVRKAMKESNPILFAEYLEKAVGKKRQPF